MKDILEVAELIPLLAREYGGDLLEVLGEELEKRNLSLEEFIVELSEIVNDLTA